MGKIFAASRCSHIQYWLCVIVSSVVLSIPGSGMAQANEDQEGPAAKAVEASSKVTAATYGGISGTRDLLTGMGIFHPYGGMLNMFAGQGKDSEVEGVGKADEYTITPNTHNSRSILVRPLSSIRGYGDSDVIKDMLKEMVTKQVPVLMQTMYMVENGAASGYGQALNAVTNIMSNSVASHDLTLKLMDLLDENGQQKYAYAAKFQELAKKDNSFLAAFHGVLGDAGTSKEDSGGKEQYKSTSKDGAFKIVDANPSENNGTGAGGDSTKLLLSALLFPEKSGQSNAPNGSGNGDNKNKLKSEFLAYVGDVEFKQEKTNNTIEAVREVKEEFIKPTKEEDKVTGAILAHREYLDKVWKAWFIILNDYCKFKNDEGNLGKKIFEKEVIWTSKKYLKEKEWATVSAPDIPMTLNLVDQAYQLIVKRGGVKDVNCDKVVDTNTKIPSKIQSGEAKDFDPCDKDNENGCLRNRLFFYITNMIATSKTLHRYKYLYEASKLLASDTSVDFWVDKVFQQVPGIKIENGVSDIDYRIAQNEESWLDFLQWMGKLVQGSVGSGSPYRPSMSSGLTNPPGSAENGAPQK